MPRSAWGTIDTLNINNSWAGSVPLWFRLLNCGFRVPATAGTDVFLNRIDSRLPGGDLVYVHLDGPLTYQKWIEGLKAGRSFATNGPMLTFTVNGKEPVYVEVNGLGYRSAEDARAFQKWIDGFEIVLRSRNRFPTERLRNQAYDRLEAARSVYAKIIRDAK